MGFTELAQIQYSNGYAPELILTTLNLISLVLFLIVYEFTRKISLFAQYALQLLEFYFVFSSFMWYNFFYFVPRFSARHFFYNEKNCHFTYEQKNTHIKSASPSCIVVQHRKGSVLTSIPCRSIGSLSIVFHNSREWKAEKYNYLGTSRVAQINNAKTAQIFLKMLLMAGNCKVRSGWHWWENAHNAILHHPRFKSFTLNTEKKRWRIYFSGFFFLQK